MPQGIVSPESLPAKPPVRLESPPQGPPGPPGYHSPQARNRYLAIAVALSVVCLLGRWIVPSVAGLFLSPMKHAVLHSRIKAHQLNNAAVCEGNVWYAQNTAGLSDGLTTQLVAVPLAGDRRPTVMASLEAGEPWMLAGEDRLWIIWAGGTAWYRDGQVHAIDSAAPPPGVSRPFLYEGQPALVRNAGNETHLVVFDGKTWGDRAKLSIPFPPQAGGWGEQMQVVRHKGEYHLFCRPPLGANLRYHRGMPGAEEGDPDDWESPAKAPGQWKAASLGDELALFFHRSGEPNGPWLVGLKRGDNGWTEFFRHKIGLDVGLGIGATGTEGGFVVLRRVLPLGAEVIGVEDGRVAWKADVSGTVERPGGMLWRSIVLRAMPWVFPLLLALLLAPWMARYRIAVHVGDGRQARYAPLWRRGIAAGIDVLIAIAPIVAFGWNAFGQIEPENLGLLSILWALVKIACFAIPWLLGMLLVMSLLEGRWSATPGKAALRIRVRRTTLKRCGFGRAVLRNLIRPVDMLFGGMLGLILAAFTPRWQRLGDLAAGTVVVRAADLRRDPAAG